MKDHIVVIGAGKFGSYLATSISTLGSDVVLIDKNPEEFSTIADSFVGIELVGDASDLSVLEEAQVSKASQVVIVTKNDNTNIFLANICSTIFKVPKIFLMQNSNDKAGLLAGYNFNVIYPFNLSVKEYFNLSGDLE